MDIVGKEYRHIESFKSKTYDDVTGKEYSYNAYIYIYIYDWETISRLVTRADYECRHEYGNISIELRKTQLTNLNKQIKKGNNPVSIGTYKIFDKNKIEMRWHFFRGGEIEILFKGEILLNGDAIKGTFYKDGEINVSERVYYNIDKLLPEMLIT